MKALLILSYVDYHVGTIYDFKEVESDTVDGLFEAILEAGGECLAHGIKVYVIDEAITNLTQYRLKNIREKLYEEEEKQKEIARKKESELKEAYRAKTIKYVTITPEGNKAVWSDGSQTDVEIRGEEKKTKPIETPMNEEWWTIIESEGWVVLVKTEDNVEAFKIAKENPPFKDDEELFKKAVIQGITCNPSSRLNNRHGNNYIIAKNNKEGFIDED